MIFAKVPSLSVWSLLCFCQYTSAFGFSLNDLPLRDRDGLLTARRVPFFFSEAFFFSEVMAAD
jgi:hypothetical protein